MKKKLLLGLLVVVTLFTLTGCGSKTNNVDEPNLNIIMESIQTHEYHEYKPDNQKYYINNKEELKIFGVIYSDILDKYSEKLTDNSLFVMVSEENSGSITLELKSVDFSDNKIKFVIDREEPEVGTADMAFWYLVALIPNEKIKAMNFDDWKKPSIYTD